MPINTKTIIKFGTGELSISAGLSKNNKTGFVGIGTQKARPIGSKGETQRIGNIPVVMEFANVESLDALIKQLNNARKLMTGELDINDSP